MPLDDPAQPPFLTADFPGIGGCIKSQTEDFEVEEIPAYAPSGQGDFLYLWIEKRAMGAEYFARQVAHRLGLPNGEVGTAGLKDRHAVTRQMVSVPAHAEPNLSQLEGDGIRVLSVGRHSNKLRPGHLHGNRFRILVRQCRADVSPLPILERIREFGQPNYYGAQRFGREGETLTLGWQMLRGERADKPVRNPFLKKLALSAVQSCLFNDYLARRQQDDLLRTVLPGDVMAKVPAGGMFVTEDVATEQQRFDAREIVTAGPIFGKKTFPARDQAALREKEILDAQGLSSAAFQGFGKLVMGTRRHNLVYVEDLRGTLEPDGWRFEFTLPAGSYATILLREIMKIEPGEGDEVE